MFFHKAKGFYLQAVSQSASSDEDKVTDGTPASPKVLSKKRQPETPQVDLMAFTGLMQVCYQVASNLLGCIKLHQACWVSSS